MYKVLINPEHGGGDPGAIYEGFYECNIAAILTHIIEDYLKLHHPEIAVMYRPDNWGFQEPYQRANVANNMMVQLMVTISLNAGGGSGLEVWVSPGAFTATREYAKIMVEAVRFWYEEKKLPLRGIKENNFTVLEKTNMPSLLIETGFLDNQNDRRYLTDYRELVSLGIRIARGILRAQEYATVGNQEV